HDPTPDLLGDAIAAFQRMDVPDRPREANVFVRINAHRSSCVGPGSSRTGLNRRRIIQVLLSSAAVLLLLTGGLARFSRNGAAPPAVADVVKSARNHKLVRYKQRQTVSRDEVTVAQIDRTLYADLATPRLRIESPLRHADDKPVLIHVQDRVRQLATNADEKTARLALTPKDFKSFCCSLEEFEQKKGVSRAREMLGGLATVRYRFTEDSRTSSLWIDARTRLPVRMEEELATSRPTTVGTRFVSTDFEWDPALPKGFGDIDELFSTQPPEGYALDDQTSEK